MHLFQYATLSFVLFAYILNSSKCAKILSVFPNTGPSQYICGVTYLKELAARGHEVTSVSAFPQKKPIQNFRDIVLKTEEVPHDDLVTTTIDAMAGSKLNELRALREYVIMGAELTLKSEAFQQLLQSGEKFDIIIIEVFFQDSLYVLGQHFNAPMIGISTFGADVTVDQLVDNISPVSYVPPPSSRNLDGMNFWQRLDNLYLSTMELLYSHLVLIPENQRIYETYFPNATLSLSEVRRDFSLLLLNQHYSLSWPRPYVPNAIEVAGMHIHHIPNKLPEDMESFINASPNGAIYFSLGSNIKSSLLPKEKLAIIMDVFASLPVNVLWKFEKTDLPGKPKNVYISKWFPQPDVLAHPKVKLFITHGGMHSYIESVHFAKPIVAMPVFYDQHLNAERAKTKGLGVVVNFRELSKKELHSAILEVLNNPKYAEKAKEISARFHDRPMSPLDTAIYWTEYLLRHKGAPYLRVAARQLNFLQRNSVDTMAVLFGIPLVILIVFIVGLVKVCRAVLCGTRRQGSEIVNKRKRE